MRLVSEIPNFCLRTIREDGETLLFFLKKGPSNSRNRHPIKNQPKTDPVSFWKYST